jgi:hypothetical protein
MTSRAMMCRPDKLDRPMIARRAEEHQVDHDAYFPKPAARPLIQVLTIEISFDTRTVGILGHDDRRRAGLLRHLRDLVPAEVIGRKQHRNLPGTHQLDDLIHVTGRRRDARLGLDVGDARHLEARAEVGPVLVIARDLAACEGLCGLEPAAEPGAEGTAFVIGPGQEGVELTGLEQVEGGARREDPDQVGPHRGLEYAALEILFPALEVLGVGRGHAGEPGQDVPCDDDGVERVSVNVRIAVGVDIPFRPAEGDRNLEQRNPGVRGHVAGPALGHLPVVGAVEQRRDPELEVESGGDKDVRVPKQCHEARLGLHEVRVLVTWAIRSRWHGRRRSRAMAP